MSKLTHRDVIRAWKDADFRNQLSAEQRAALPESPAGVVELSCAELNDVVGGRDSGVSSIPCELDKLGYTKNTFPCCRTQDITCDDNLTVGGKFVISS